MSKLEMSLALSFTDEDGNNFARKWTGSNSAEAFCDSMSPLTKNEKPINSTKSESNEFITAHEAFLKASEVLGSAMHEII